MSTHKNGNDCIGIGINYVLLPVRLNMILAVDQLNAQILVL